MYLIEIYKFDLLFLLLGGYLSLFWVILINLLIKKVNLFFNFKVSKKII